MLLFGEFFLLFGSFMNLYETSTNHPLMFLQKEALCSIEAP